MLFLVQKKSAWTNLEVGDRFQPPAAGEWRSQANGQIPIAPTNVGHCQN
jgi:hypothetical protein